MSKTKSKTQPKTQWFLVVFGALFTIAGLISVLDPLSKLLAAIGAKRNVWQEDIWVGLVVAGVFLLVGLSIVNMGFRLRRDNVRASTLPKLSDGAGALDRTIDSQILKPYQGGTRRAFIFLLMFSIVWVGIVGFFMVHDSSPMLWLFALVGVVLVVATVGQGLILLNPKVMLSIYDLPLTMGSKANVIWQIGSGSAQASKVTDFSIVLIGQERATYHRGTDSYTDTHDFYSQRYELSRQQLQAGKGSIMIHVPEQTMHTWHSQNNEVVWLLHVQGTIPRWPNIDEKYEITVFPKDAV